MIARYIYASIRGGIAGFSLCATGVISGADGPGVPNLDYASEREGEILSKVQIKGISATALHRGYLYVPLSSDGAGYSSGEFAFYDVSNPSNPVKVFHTKNDVARYHTPGTQDYMGDLAEQHNISISENLILISENRWRKNDGFPESAGFSVLDTSALFDNDPATKPSVVSRYSYEGVTSPNGYDGFSFSLAWQGRRYVYAPTGAQGLYVIDTTDLSNPVQLKHVSRAALGNVTLRAAWPIGNVLILTSAEGGSFQGRVFDISNPANPLQLSAFSGPLGYHGFVYGSAYYGGGKPIVRHDFTNPSSVVNTVLVQNPDTNIPEYGFGKDGDIFIGHYPGSTQWKFTPDGNSLTPSTRVNSGIFDDHAFINPLGNLILLCSDHNNDRNFMIGIQSAQKDTIPPKSLFVSPADGATNQHVLSRVGISFSDFVDPMSVNTSTMIVRKFTTEEVVPGTYSVMQGIVNFVPDAQLEPNTTYDVILAPGGVKDQVGNAVPAEVRVSRFSTGSALNDYTVKINATNPKVVGDAASFSLNVTNQSGLVLEHSWDFGDGSPQTAFSTAATASHAYDSPGNYSVLVRTRIQGQGYAPGINGVQVVHRPIPATLPVNHSTIMPDPARSLVWNVNPDNDSISAIDTTSLTRTYEIQVGNKPMGLALGPNDRLWVVNKESANLSVINRANGIVVATYPLPVGSAPHGLVIDSVAGFAYVTLEATGQLAKVNTTTGAVVATLAVGPWPRGLALDPSRQKLWVSRFISPDDGGRLSRVNLTTFTVESNVSLSAVLDSDSLQNGRGIPNYLAAPVISPDLTQAYVPSKKDNMFRGLLRDGQPLTFEHSVRSMAANINLSSGQENPTMRLDFDNSDFATAAAFSPLGNMVFFTTSGSATVWAVDAYNPASTYTFNSDGQAPDGIAVSADGSRIYIHNFMDRSVTVYKSTVACGAVCGTAPRLAKISTVTTDQLSPQVLRGKQLFYSSNDPRVSQEGYMSCASCHLDGGHDGRTWDFSNFGEGLRNTIDLNGKGLGHGPLHWTGNFDEVQDFEGQIRDFASGSGILSEGAFHRGTRALPLGESKTGLSSDLDALAAYVRSLTAAGRSPHRNTDGSLTASAQAGREIFRQANCASCHEGSSFTDSASLMFHDVGTQTAASGARLGGPLVGLDTPGLRGLWHSAPYLHDGSAATLRDVLVTRNPNGAHGNLSGRTSAEIDQLVSYLLSIDDLETTAPTTATGSAPIATSPGNQVHTVRSNVSVPLGATGTGSLNWQAMSLPPGLSLNGVTGVISGVPTHTGTFTAQVAVRDAAGRSSSISFGWTVTDPAARRYVRLVTLSSHNATNFTSMAEFHVLGADGKPIDRSEWTVSASSQETSSANNAAINAIDGNNGSIWHTRWSGVAFPHTFTIDMKYPEAITGFSCLPRQDGSRNGRFKDYEFYWSSDGVNWTLINAGAFPDNGNLQTVQLDTDGDGFNDCFEYAIGSDPHNATSQPPALYTGIKGWWKLDEAEGMVANDVIGIRPGELRNRPVRNAGSLEFNGTTQSVRIPALDLNTNSFTLGCWVKRNGNQTSMAGIAFVRDSAASGLMFGPSNKLYYTWNGGQFNFNSNLTVPDNTWTYCAIVVEPTRATLYMKPEGGSMQTAVNQVAHAAAPLTGALDLGQDAIGGRFFKGALDDVRVYARALTAAELANPRNLSPVFLVDPIVGNGAMEGSAYTGSIAGSANDPDSGGVITYSKVGGPSWLSVAPNGALTGMPGMGNAGANNFTVRVTDSAGAFDDAALTIQVTKPAGTGDADGDGYSNALEESLGTNPYHSSSTPGSLYAGLKAWWRLDETSGTFADDATGTATNDGTLLGGAIWSAALSGNGINLSGTNGQSVRGPVFNLNTNTATITAWVKRNGSQVDWSGIAYAWQNNTPSGMMVGPGNQLRYTWSGSHYSFNSGLLIPDNVWTYCSVVIEPTKATIYMQPVNGAMQTATNNASHAPAPFANNFYLGRDAGVSNRLFRGVIDEVRLYTRSLNADEQSQLATLYALPLPWEKATLGTGALAGGANFAHGIYTLSGSGLLGGANDQVQYAYQALSGDGDIVAKIASLHNTGAGASVGVMVRSSLASNAPYVFVGSDGAGTYQWSSRGTTGGAATVTTGTAGTPGNQWMKLTRMGNSFSVFTSANGASWTPLGTVNVTMGSNSYIGLAASSGNAATINTSQFSNVSVTP